MLRSVLFFVVFTLAATAAAEDLNYTFLQGSFERVEIDASGFEGDTLGLNGSYALSDNVHIFGGFGLTDFDLDVERTSLDIGIGYNTPISETVDLVGTLSYVSQEFDAPGQTSIDDNGYGLGLGLRAVLSESIEVNGGLEYIDLNDFGDDTAFVAGLRYHLNDMVSFGLGGQWADDTDTYLIDGRFGF